MSNNIPSQELASRLERCRTLLKLFTPEYNGLLMFSRLNIYYFTGSFVSGVLWLPLDGEPVLFCKRGVERAKIESPLKHIYPFDSYRDIKTILHDSGFSLPGVVSTSATTTV